MGFLCLSVSRDQQAKSSGKFSNEELLNLKKEFQHHKDKIHEYNILVDAVSRTEGESLQINALLNISSASFVQISVSI